MAHELIISMNDDDGDEKHINTSKTTSSWKNITTALLNTIISFISLTFHMPNHNTIYSLALYY